MEIEEEPGGGAGGLHLITLGVDVVGGVHGRTENGPVDRVDSTLPPCRLRIHFRVSVTKVAAKLDNILVNLCERTVM